MIANDIRVGNVIEYNNGRFKVLKTMHTKPGKGGAFMQVEMKEITTEQKVNNRFRSDEKINKISITESEAQFSYSDESFLYVLDLETFEETSYDIELVNEELLPFCQEGEEVILEKADDEVINIRPQKRIEITIKETNPYVKGQQQAPTFKPALLENGVKINVPAFLESGEVIVVDTETLDYVERVKK